MSQDSETGRYQRHVRVHRGLSHQDEMDRLRELVDRLEEECGEISDDEQNEALDRIAAIDAWHDEQRPNSHACA